MLPDLLPHAPTLVLTLAVLYLVVSQRRERRRDPAVPSDLADTVDRLSARVSDLVLEIGALSEHNLSTEERLLELEATLAEARERLSKHRGVLEELGGVIEHEFIRIDHQLVDLEARRDAWTYPSDEDAVDADFEIETDPISGPGFELLR